MDSIKLTLAVRASVVLRAVSITKHAARAAVATLTEIGGVALPQGYGPVVRAPVAFSQRERLEGDASSSCSAFGRRIWAVDTFGAVSSRILIILVSLANAAFETRGADVDGRRASRALLATRAFRLCAKGADGARDWLIASSKGIKSLAHHLTIRLGSDASDVAVLA